MTLKLTNEQQKLLDENRHRLVRRIIEPAKEGTPLCSLVYHIAAPDWREFTLEAWSSLIEELESEKRKLGEWADAQASAAAEDAGVPYIGDRDLGYQY